MQYSASNPVRKEFHFSTLYDGDYVLWAELWFVVVCRCAINKKISRKLFPHRNHSSGNITRRPVNYSTSFLVFLTFVGLRPRVLPAVSAHPTAGSLARQTVCYSTYGLWLTRDLKQQSQSAYVGIQKIRIKPKLLWLFLGSLKARAPPWWFLPKIQSCLSSTPSNTSNNPLGVKLQQSCLRPLTSHYCLPGGFSSSSLFGPPPLTMLSLLLWCLWLSSSATSHSVYCLIKVFPLPHIHWRPSHLCL